MGSQEMPFEFRDPMVLSVPGRATIVAAENFVADLRSASAHRGLDNAKIIALAADAILPVEAFRSSPVLVLEVDASSEASLRRLANARVEHPDVSIIAALRRADLSLVRALVRQGVADVAELPFLPAELSSQILEAISNQAGKGKHGKVGKMLSVVKANGGCGATTLLTHLAPAIVEETKGSRSVCVVDLDVQGGDVAAYLGLEPKATIEALLEAGTRLDEELIRNAITETRYGFSVVASPENILPLDTISVDQVLAILRQLRSMFDYVMLDLPAGWTDWSLSAVTSSDRVMLLTEASISSLRQAKRRIRLLGGVDFPSSNIEVVVSRVERRLFRTVSNDDVEETLGCKVVGGLANETSTLREAQNQGLLVSSQGKTRYWSDVENLAELIVADRRGD